MYSSGKIFTEGVIDMNLIGKNIKTSRERCNMSQKELAHKIRVGSAKIEKYETGASIPDTLTILKICTVLDIPVSTIMNSGLHSTQIPEHIPYEMYNPQELNESECYRFLNHDV